MSEQKNLDQQRLFELYGNDLNFKHFVFSTFIEEIPHQIENFKYNFDAGNYIELRKISHSLKPSFGMVGLTNIENLLKTIEMNIQLGMIEKIPTQEITAFLKDYPIWLKSVKSEILIL